MVYVLGVESSEVSAKKKKIYLLYHTIVVGHNRRREAKRSSRSSEQNITEIKKGKGSRGPYMLLSGTITLLDKLIDTLNTLIVHGCGRG